MTRTVITKTPLRLPLGGGGTDLPAYVKEHGGFIFGASLDKYIYVTVTASDLDDKIFISAPYDERNEATDTPDGVENALVREALRLTGIKGGVTISSAADVLLYGTGLGSSGAFLVGLLHALYALKNEKVSKDFLAEQASHIFLDSLGSSEGKQDPYLAARGGYTAFELDRNNRVSLLTVSIAPEVSTEFQSRTLYFYTGVRRKSSEILDDHQKKVIEGVKSVLEYRHRVKTIGKEILSAFEGGNMDRFGGLLHEHWEAKKASSSAVTLGFLDTLYNQARDKGMLGGKILGAGGGGFFMAFAGKGRNPEVRRCFSEAGLREVKMRIGEEGTAKLFDSETV